MSVKEEEFKKSVQEYWEKPNTISIIDKNFHKIEIESVSNHLKSSDYVIDVGCGNGEATVEYARRVKKVLAIERSNNLRSKAEQNAKKAGLKNISFQPGDIMNFKDVRPQPDAIVTQRLLINLTSWEEQRDALQNIYNALKKGGRYIMVENTNQAFNQVNKMRGEVGLKPIPIHWHNLFFDRKKLLTFMKGKFELVKEYDFSLYYFLTRLYVQMFASFEGYGINAVKDPIFDKSDEAARILYQKFHDKIKFEECMSTIQVFVFKRK